MAQQKDDMLRSEIVGLVQYINRFRDEIAQMVQRGDDDQTHFSGVSDQLDEIIHATEVATNAILENVEAVEDITDKIKASDDIEEIHKLCDEINTRNMNAMEACTFQDITGQRVTKIVRSMKFVEERVNAMAELWGREEVDNLAASYATKDEEKDADAALLNGPALPQETSISQDDIDALFD
jgi:chemotaxis protein CheZ